MSVRNKVFVDTLFVVALINRRDQYHARALELAENFENFYSITTDAILLEIGNALSGSYKRESAELIDHFLASDDVEVVRLNPDLFEKALTLYKRHQDKSWGLVDCVSFVVMQENQVTDALTFDHHFVQAGFRALMRRMPE